MIRAGEKVADVAREKSLQPKIIYQWMSEITEVKSDKNYVLEINKLNREVEELYRLKRISNRIIVKEDVFGIPMDKSQFKGVVDSDPLLQEFCKFNLQDHFMVLMLSDYVSNVFIHGRTDMSFAFEFKSIPEWRKVFNSNELKLVDEYLVGFRRGKFSGSCHAYFIVDVI